MGSANAILPQITYQSKIALAVQAVQMKSTYQLLQLLPTVSAMDQGVTSNFDFDKMTRGMARTLNVPTEYIRDERTVKQMRDEQAQQAQAQQAQLAPYTDQSPLGLAASHSYAKAVRQRLG